MNMQVPTIDIAPFLEGAPDGKRRVAGQVGRACEEIGFLTIVGHGVPNESVEKTYRLAREFFDLPEAEKLKYKLRADGVGYSPLRGEQLAATLGDSAPADLKESLNIGTNLENNLLPEQPHGFKPTLTEYFRAMENLAGTLMCVFALALSLRENFFDDKINNPNSFLRLINYPNQEQEPLPGQLRAGAHSDYGTLTILRAENAPGGLQVQTRNGEWLEVGPIQDAFIINIGDLMMRWTNDKWISTLHRVVNPPRDRALGSRRQSLVFFHNPNNDAVVECLPSCCDADHPAKYAPITAGEHLALKTRKAYRM